MPPGVAVIPGALVLRLAYVALLALATLAPFHFRLDAGFALERLAGAFRFQYGPVYLVDAVRNVALFAGWGALWAVTAPPAPARVTLRPALATGLLLSVALELIQLVLPRRNTSIIDVGTNGLGVVVGVLAISAAIGLLRGRRQDKSHVGLPAWIFAACYGTAAFLDAMFAPFRLQPYSGVFGGPFARFEGVLLRFSWGDGPLPLGDTFLLLPAGCLAYVALIELGWPRANAVRLLTVAGLFLSAAAEVLHGFLALPIQPGTALFHGATFAAGAWLTARLLPAWTREIRGRSRPVTLLLAYSLVLLLWAWRPYDPAPLAQALGEFTWSRLIPLAGSAPRIDLFSVVDIVESFLLCFPLGALLAVWPARRRGYLAGILPGLYLVTLGEVGQPFIAGRYCDVTDILVGVAGLGIGWVVLRRAGFTAHGEMLPA